uniref:Uncharacterized protein n=1 Tax=Tetranychus urticae TaxID=32264 RepID=T1KIE0_TETUR
MAPVATAFNNISVKLPSSLRPFSITMVKKIPSGDMAENIVICIEVKRREPVFSKSSNPMANTTTNLCKQMAKNMVQIE